MVIKLRKMKWHVACIEEMRNPVLGGRAEAKRLIARHRWKCNIKVVCKEIGCEKIDLIYLV